MSEETAQQHNRRSYDQEVAVLKARFTDFLKGTEEYRARSVLKQDKILDTLGSVISRLDKLPCDIGKSRWENVNRNIIAIWGFIGAIVIIIITEWIRK